jgi:allantoin racemase
MRILVLLPTLKNEQLELDTYKELQRIRDRDLSFDVKTLEWGPSSVESEYDERLASPMILEQVKDAEREGYDAVFISCTDDVALSAAREVAKIPIVAPLEVSVLVASTLGEKFSILAVLKSEIPVFYRRLRGYGAIGRLASIKSIDIPVLDLHSKREEVMKSLIAKAKEAIEQDGADTIILGCTGMLGMAKDIQNEVGLPVIDPVLVAVKYAQLLVSANLTHSKLAYPTPSSKERILPSINKSKSLPR